MKSLFIALFPTIRAFIGAISFLMGVGWGAYASIQLIAKSEASIVKEELKAWRGIDKEHFDEKIEDVDGKLTRVEIKLDELKDLIKENK